MSNKPKIKSGKDTINSDIKRGFIEVSIANCSDKLFIDITDNDVITAIDTFDKKYISYRENKNLDIEDFSVSVEAIFGDDSCEKIFGHKLPNPIQIKEFLEDFCPILARAISASNIIKMRKKNVK